MNIIIDANVVKGYFNSEVHHTHDLTSDPSYLFKNNSDYKIYLDNQGHIEYEWKSQVCDEWCNDLISMLIDNDIFHYKEASESIEIESKIKSNNFPDSRDIWYIRVAFSVSESNDFAEIISEDLHFFEPTAKRDGSQSRTNILRNRIGSITDILEDYDIFVHSVHTHET